MRDRGYAERWRREVGKWIQIDLWYDSGKYSRWIPYQGQVLCVSERLGLVRFRRNDGWLMCYSVRQERFRRLGDA